MRAVLGELLRAAQLQAAVWDLLASVGLAPPARRCDAAGVVAARG